MDLIRRIHTSFPQKSLTVLCDSDGCGVFCMGVGMGDGCGRIFLGGWGGSFGGLGAERCWCQRAGSRDVAPGRSALGSL